MEKSEKEREKLTIRGEIASAKVVAS